MAGALHAAALLAIPLATAGLLVKTGRKPSVGRALASLGLGVLAGLVALSLGLHGCGLGQPVTQWLIPGLCLMLVWAFVGHAWTRRLTAIVLLVAMAGLSLHYSQLVHGPTYVGRASVPAHYEVGPIEATWHNWLTGLYRRP